MENLRTDAVSLEIYFQFLVNDTDLIFVQPIFYKIQFSYFI